MVASTELVTRNGGSLMEQVLIKGDLADLTAEQRVSYYQKVCESVGLNHLTQPFAYLKLNGKLQLYARKDCTDQLRGRDGISIEKVTHELIGDVFVVTVHVKNDKSRMDSDIGAVNVKGLMGDALANAYMKAHTKAKRRATLSICGLGFLDESEVETIPGALTHDDPEPPQQQVKRVRDVPNREAWLKRFAGLIEAGKLVEAAVLEALDIASFDDLPAARTKEVEQALKNPPAEWRENTDAE